MGEGSLRDALADSCNNPALLWVGGSSDPFMRSFFPLVFEFCHSARVLFRERLFSLSVSGTVALCLAANLVVFTVVQAVLLKPLPYHEPDRLVITRNCYANMGALSIENSIVNYDEFRAHIPAFAEVGLCRRSGSAILGDEGSVSRVSVQEALPSLFSVLGVQPVLGRLYSEAESVNGPEPVAVISHSFWQSRFQGSPDVLGRVLRLDGISVRIIGVMPEGFRYLSSDTQIFRPLVVDASDRQASRRHSMLNYDLVARLQPGCTVAQAQDQLDRFNESLLDSDPMAQLIRNAGFRTLVSGLHDRQVERVRTSLLLLQAGALLLLLIGVVNLVNLLFVRRTAQFKERAVREALGAGRVHLFAGDLGSVLTPCLLGGLGGLALGSLLVRGLAWVGVERLPLMAGLEVDSLSACGCLLLSAVVGFLLSLLLQVERKRTLGEGLAAGGSRGASAGKLALRARFLLVTTQVALVFMLLSGAGVLALSLREVMRLPSGFETRNLLVSHYGLPGTAYTQDPACHAYAGRLLRALRELPGDNLAGLSTCIPLGGRTNTDSVTIEGLPAVPGQPPPNHYITMVAGDYFKAMGIRLRAGRYLDDADCDSASRNCVIDEEVARRYWPGRSPLGARLHRGLGTGSAYNASFVVVGVVRSVKQLDLAEPVSRGMIYLPFRAESAPSGAYVVLKTAKPVVSASALMREAYAKADAGIPVDELGSMARRVEDSLGERRAPVILAGFFAVLALLLTVLGIYGVLAFAVSQQRREIGIRLALGASPGRVCRSYLGLAAWVLFLGLGLGFLGARLSARIMGSLLYGVMPLDRDILLLCAGTLSCLVLVASYAPARKAARTEVLEVLR